ncbi:hypothetical protein EDD16DRAFT_1726636 [Pisolithus croceorrhizus]|nr:hypothetical protein EV401DRAFT_1890211 [Pisolithus croceorrhizus]KAI6119064.1 hypothetical protein EDD16DRAFT_1726636 [Pisolithus croceorrhizus]KAI6163356.1 hypothetical protein EDD17DRAFT_1507353 [Pisolithus thermaeus]
MAHPSEHYHACPNFEKSCECEPANDKEDLGGLWYSPSSFSDSLCLDSSTHGGSSADTRARPPLPPIVGFYVPEDPPQLQCVYSQNWTDYFDQPTWSTEPYGAVTSFSLPVDAGSLYLLSRSANQLGNLKITQSNKEPDVVDVDIRVAYQSKDTLGLATVCLTGGGENQYSVSILTPPHKGRWFPRWLLHFDVELTLPAAKEGSTLDIKPLTTCLPIYSKDVTVQFLTPDASLPLLVLVSLRRSTAIFLVTSKGGLLELVTVNGHIDTTVTLLNNEFASLTSKLVTRSANGSCFDLSSEARWESTGGFVDIAFTESPVGSVLKVVAATTNGEVKVAVPSVYEVSYLGTTAVGKVFVMERDAEDPEGKGRIIKNSVGNRVKATIY